ncbi:MAG: MCE family protein [Microbacterium sp.]|nr:MAG: MCE family protein [Microbacterium sp.]
MLPQGPAHLQHPHQPLGGYRRSVHQPDHRRGLEQRAVHEPGGPARHGRQRRQQRRAARRHPGLGPALPAVHRRGAGAAGRPAELAAVQRHRDRPARRTGPVAGRGRRGPGRAGPCARRPVAGRAGRRGTRVHRPAAGAHAHRGGGERAVTPSAPLVKSQSKIPSSVYKVITFAVVTAVLIALLGTLIGNVRFGASRTYYGLFTDATGVFSGDRVRLSCVEVGSVTGLELVTVGDRKVAKVEFTVDESVPVYPDARLELRYENIVGQRYLNIDESPQQGATAKDGTTFAVDRTTPALSLTELFNGFQPLFRALDPERLNTFSFELVRALQGESGSIQSLMRNTAQLTNTIADKDQVIGSVVNNLNAVLTTVGDRDEKLTDLVVQFKTLMAGLAGSSDVIGASLPSLNRLLDATAGTIRDIRPPLRSSVGSLNTLAGQVLEDRQVLDKSLQDLPFLMRTLARTASYGSWFNFYICGLQVNLTLLDGTVNLGNEGISANERGTVCAGGVR